MLADFPKTIDASAAQRVTKPTLERNLASVSVRPDSLNTKDLEAMLSNVRRRLCSVEENIMWPGSSGCCVHAGPEF